MATILRGYTLRYLIYATYTFWRSRERNAKRDMIKVLQVQKVSVYDGKNPGEARTKYVIRSQSYPQYYPYFQSKDVRGRDHTKQRTIHHEYDVTIQMDTLHIDSVFKYRTGADCRVLFGAAHRSQWADRPKNASRTWQRRLIKEDDNVKRGRNLDFFFTFEYVLHRSGNLFGRNWTNGPPSKRNPKHLPGLDKHSWNVVQYMITHGLISK